MAIDLYSKLGNLIKFLPTGTVFVFHFLNPVFSDYGNCNKPLNKYLTATLIALCGFTCCFNCFTDSYKGRDGKTHYGVATVKGLWPSPDESHSVDSSSYKLRFSDFVHAFFSSVVFAVLVLVEPNTVECFYPSLATSSKALLCLIFLPPIALVVSLAFACFPMKRHGIGYPSLEQSSKKTDPLLPF
ncbi:hypothetical protein PTKIN_Ptkin09bG0030200 [Pterospermum kingtungense]